MKKSWTEGLNEQEKEDFISSFSSSFLMRKRLVYLLEEKVKVSSNTGRSKGSYNNPNWAYLRADQAGYERAMHDIISLIN